MIFKDEKYLWNADVEAMATLLANKSEQDVLRILDNYCVVRLHDYDRPKATTVNRIAFLVLFTPLMITAAVKWLVSGNAHLDSWEKKYKLVGWIYKMIGVDKDY